MVVVLIVLAYLDNSKEVGMTYAAVVDITQVLLTHIRRARIDDEKEEVYREEEQQHKRGWSHA